MNDNLYLEHLAKAHAALVGAFAPIMAFGSFFVARSQIEIYFACSLLVLPLLCWRVFALRLWAGVAMALLGLALTVMLISMWPQTDFPFNLIGLLIGLAPSVTLLFGWRMWRKSL